MHAVKIVLLSIIAAVCYGIAHDQVTARVCVEYFTVGHEPIFGTDSPTLLGIGWGIIATWWVGLLLGVPLAIAARAGKRPKRTWRDLLRPLGVLLAVMGACALLWGCVGYDLTAAGVYPVSRFLMENLPTERHARFMADAFAHEASYTVGMVGGIVLVALTWHGRRKAAPAVPTAEEAAAKFIRQRQAR